MSLSAEALGLAVMAELPCIVVNVQRGGPSTGLPTKTEQADLLQALFGRHGECPLPGARSDQSPRDCFAMAYEAARLAIRFMTPVVRAVGYLFAQSAQAWRVPARGGLGRRSTCKPSSRRRRARQRARLSCPMHAIARLAAPWALPGTPGLEHRIGGLEKEADTGNVSYDPLNHEALVKLRAAKIARIADEHPAAGSVMVLRQGDLLVIGWGSTHGRYSSAVGSHLRQGSPVACAQLRYLNPLPKNLGEVLRRYKKVLVPELNSGQLLMACCAPASLSMPLGYNKIQGSPFLIREIEAKIEELF